MTDLKVRCNLERTFGAAESKISIDWKLNASSDSSNENFIIWYIELSPELKDDAIWSFLIGVLSLPERQKVLQYLNKDDQKRSLLSILIQKGIIRHSFAFEENTFEIMRTRENKPYLFSPQKEIGKWNYNVSHQGDVVCIASHPNLLIGIDVVDLRTRSNLAKSFIEYVQMFENILTNDEIKYLLSFPSESTRYDYFYIIWSLKEAFVKAIGIGLGYELNKVHFTLSFSEAYKNGIHDIEGTAIATIDGKRNQDWRFEFFGMSTHYVIGLALGPTPEATDSYRFSAWDAATVKTEIFSGSSCGIFGSRGKKITELTPESPEYSDILNKSTPRIVKKTIGDILPHKHLSRWNVLLNQYKENLQYSINEERQLNDSIYFGSFCAPSTICHES